MGARLAQDVPLVAFASPTLAKAERRYAQIGKECLAIVFRHEKFRYLMQIESNTLVESDHKPLQSILAKSLLTAPKHIQ